jgi:hypothetical protein
MGRRSGYVAIVGVVTVFLYTTAVRAAGAYGPVLDAPRASLASPQYTIDRLAIVPGGLVVQGFFNFADGTLRRSLARLDDTGRVDPSWRARGLPCLDAGNCRAYALTALADGSVLICGNAADLGHPPSGGLIRLDMTGAYDPTWKPLPAAGLAEGNRDCTGVLVTDDIVDISAGRSMRMQIAAAASDGSVLAAFSVAPNMATPTAADARWLYRNMTGTNAIERMARVDGSVDTGWRVEFERQPRIEGHDPASRSLIVTTFGETASTQLWFRVDIRAGAIDPAWQPALPPPHPLNRVRLGAGRMYFRLCTLQHWFNCRLHALAVATPQVNLWPEGVALVSGSDTVAVDAGARPILVSPMLDIDPRRRLERLRADGAPDTIFSPRLASFASVTAQVPDRGGSIVVGPPLVDAAWTCGSARFDADGAYDTGWTACPELFASGFTTRRGTSYVTDGDEMVFAGTYWDDSLTYYAYIERVFAGGARLVISDSFRAPPVIPAVNRERINALGHDPERGSLIAGGEFDVPVCGQARRHLVRLADDAYCVLDPAFAPQPDAPVTALARAADGGWYVAGRFGTIGGVATGPLAQLGTDLAGTVVPGFTPLDRIEKAGQVVGPAGLVATPDALYLYGDFDRVDGLPRSGLARVRLSDGSFDTGFAPSLAGRPLSVLADGRWLDIAIDRGTAGAPATDQVCRVDVVTGAIQTCVDTDGDITAIVATGRDSVRVAGAYTRIGGVDRTGIADLPRTLFADSLE